MGIISCGELGEDRDYSLTKDGTSEATRVFRVVFDNTDVEGPFAAVAAVSLAFGIERGGPYLVSAFEADLACVAESMTAKFVGKIGIGEEQSGGAVYDVTVKYNSATEDPNDQTNPGDNPLLQPAELEGDFASEQEPFQVDATGKILRNSAKDYFANLPVRDNRLHVVRISWNVDSASFAPNTAFQFSNCVNSDTYLGAPAGTLRITSFKYKYDSLNGINFVALSLELTYKPIIVDENGEPDGGWKYIRILDEGLRQLKTPAGGGTDILVPIYEKGCATIPVSTPKLLDGKGKQLDDGKDPVYLTFQPYKSVAYSSYLPNFLI